MSDHVTARRVNATGRSTSKFSDPRFKKLNAVPKGQAFVWLTREMVESPAWRAMSQNARLVIDRVSVEHMAHAGGQNGFLPVTYDDFERIGIRRGSIRRAVAEALALGFLELTKKGVRGWGEYPGQASLFRLAWLPTCDGTPATSRWRRIETLLEAERIAAEARESASSKKDTEAAAEFEPIQRVKKNKSQ